MLAHSDYGIRKYKLEKVNLREYLHEIISNGECYDFQGLNIDGSDLIQLGFNGVKLGQVKAQILDLVMRYELKNEKQILVNYAKTLL